MKTPKQTITPTKLLLTVVYILMFPTLILVLSGDGRWAEGWIFSIWFTLLSIRTIVYLYRNNPELLAERYKKPGSGGQSNWDKYLVYSLVIGFTLWIIMMPLDAKRFGLTSLPYWVKTVGTVGLCYSYYFFFYSYKDNSFLSPLVRLQKERKQQVAQTGVYSMVRHPMYLGGILLFICAPMLMGSILGLIIGIVLSALLIGRIFGEERLLNAKLEGYNAYTETVKYRLIPFVW